MTAGLTDMDAERIKECVREVLTERSTVDTDIHREHHQFLAECIPLLRDFLAYRAVRMEQKKRWDDRWTKVQASAIGAVTVALVGVVMGGLAWIGQLVVHALQHPLPPGGQ